MLQRKCTLSAVTVKMAPTFNCRNKNNEYYIKQLTSESEPNILLNFSIVAVLS